MSDTLFTDLVLRYTMKGDLPGHEFHGNQYEAGSGSGGSESSGSSVNDAIEQIAAHNRAQEDLNKYNATHVKPHDKVKVFVHTSPMAARAGKPKVKVVGTVTTTDTNDRNEQIARIEFEHNGKSGSAWINTATDKWQKQ